MTDTKVLESGPLLKLLLGRGGCDRPEALRRPPDDAHMAPMWSALIMIHMRNHNRPQRLESFKWNRTKRVGAPSEGPADTQSTEGRRGPATLIAQKAWGARVA